MNASALTFATWVVAIVVLGTGCASRPAPQPTAMPAPAPVAREPAAEEGPLQRFERAQTARAAAAVAQGRLADAAYAFEVLAVVQPDDPSYSRRRDELLFQVEAAIAERLPRADAARRRGDLDQAAQLYLEILAMSPTHSQAAEALRGVERERNRRSFVGKPSRLTLTRRAVSEGEVMSDDVVPASSVRNQLEHATLLARQGDVDAAIALLREGLRGNEDASQKALLADLYVQRAEAQRQRDPQAARASANAALTLDPSHAAARALLRRLPPERRPNP